MRRFANQPLIVLCLVLSLVLTTSCAPTLVDRVKTFQKVHNSHNVEKELSFFADDVTFEIVAYGTTEGKEQLRRGIERQAIFNSYLTFTDCKESGNTVTCKVMEENDLLKAAGIGPVHYDLSQYAFEDGLIKAMRARLAPESDNVLRAFRASFSKWASEKRPQEWAQLRAGLVTKENVSTWLRLALEWQAEMKKQ